MQFGNNVSSFFAILGVVLGAWGCSVNAETYSTDSAHGSTHAAVRVTQVDTAEGTSRADAMAGFLKVPPGADADQLLVLAGLHEILPAKGECRTDEWEVATSDFRQTESAELLEAESVQLVTVEGKHSLAPHAFPGIADLLRGVIYTSRDRDGRELPPGKRYQVEGRSLFLAHGARTDVSIITESPTVPSEVTVNGRPLAVRTSLPPSRVLDVAWAPLPSRDLVSVRVSGDRFGVTCTFPDSEGFGAVPLVSESGVPAEDSEFLLSVHRVRQVNGAGSDGVDELRLRFDFALEGTIALDAADVP